ncbi:molybdate ABC transporter substrate-binding protein [Dinoroseobacter sp. S76]|uniref:molybdate ABC transporter substrate-binding protein n=1 Tax=Dinoroseobacter sp. S76 TaxID=3415124 RepID=UPI003C798963
MHSRLGLAALMLICATPLPAVADVTVFAAASLKNALEEIAADWSRETDETVTLTFAASSTIARQVDQGAPADVVFLANEAWMDWLEDRDRLRPGSRGVVTGNRLVLVASEPVSLAPAPGFPLADALGEDRLAMALVDAVPAGIYGKAALSTLGIWSEVAPLVAQTDNARTALALVATGEAPFGIVYASDAQADTRVRVAGAFPASSHPPIRYPAALNADTTVEAEAFLARLHSDAARQVFARHGFQPDG